MCERGAAPEQEQSAERKQNDGEQAGADQRGAAGRVELIGSTSCRSRYVLKGRYRVRLGERDVDAPAGAFVFIPRGTPHTWQNVGAEVARFVATLAPADVRFERFFVRYSELTPDERGVDAFARIARETQGMEVLGPPLAAGAAS